MKTGLVLEGGAQRGIFTAGAVDALMEEGIKLPYVIGVSAGACNAMNYVSGQIGRSKNCMLPMEDGTYFGGRELLKSGRFLNLKKVFFEYPIRPYPFDYERYFASDIESEFVATAVEDGRPRYFRVKHCPRRLSFVGMASCSMPIVSPMVKIDGGHYMDGGIADSIPVRRALDKGCDKCIVILTRPKDTYPSVPDAMKKLYRRRYAKSPAFVESLCNRPELYKSQIALAEQLEKEGKAIVIRPELPPVGRMESDSDKLIAFYIHGHEQVMNRISEIKAFLEE